MEIRADESVRVVSFDIFDTLIVRPYARPTDLFRHIEQAEGAPGFRDERVAAERRCRRREDDSPGEVTFDEIYGHIDPKYRHLKDIEVRYERNVLPYLPVVDVFNSMVSEGRRVVLVSDMYLPSPVIEGMLESCGIHGYERLYVSCEHGVNKHRGGLFRKVLDDLGIQPNELLHIGDNPRGDGSIPKSMGIRTHQVPKLLESYFSCHPQARRFYRRDPTLSRSIIVSMDAIRWMERGDELSWREIAYRYGGPVVCGFCAFIHENTDGQLLFVARDGYNPIRVYRSLYGDERRSSYVYAPRIAYVLAGKGYRSYRGYKAMVVRRLFPERSFKDDDEAEAFFDSHEGEVEGRRAAVAAGIRAGMHEAVGEGDVTVVDVTTMRYTSQKLVSEMLDDRNVTGVYYFVLADSELPHVGYSVRTILPSAGRVNLTEFLMTAPEPPVDSIDTDGNPVYGDVNDVERMRLDIYDQITDGEVSYADALARMYDSVPSLDFDAVSAWLGTLSNTGDAKTKGMLTDMRWPVDPANTVYVSMVFHPRDSLYHMKKAVLDVMSRIKVLIERR